LVEVSSVYLASKDATGDGTHDKTGEGREECGEHQGCRQLLHAHFIRYQCLRDGNGERKKMYWRLRHIHTALDKGKQVGTSRQADRPTGNLTWRQVGRERDRQADKQVARKADRRACIQKGGQVSNAQFPRISFIIGR
jgi:hypothetical protein